jgi:hypothetical protein
MGVYFFDSCYQRLVSRHHPRNLSKGRAPCMLIPRMLVISMADHGHQYLEMAFYQLHVRLYVYIDETTKQCRQIP